MNASLQPCDYATASKITVDAETLQMLRELTGLDRGCYDWWEMSQGVKNIVMALYLLKEPWKGMGK